MSAPHRPALSRRQFLASSAGLAALALPGRADGEAPKAVAAVVTVFRPNAHADVIVNRWLEGFELDGKGDRPKSKLVALYMDQTPKGETGTGQAEKHKVPVYRTIRACLCRGGDRLAV